MEPLGKPESNVCDRQRLIPENSRLRSTACRPQDPLFKGKLSV